MRREEGLARDALVARYWPSYEKEYGWANVVLTRKRTTFRDIEESLSMDH
jgi:hypothetical protein